MSNSGPLDTPLQNQTDLARLFLNGAREGAKLQLSIAGDEMMSFGWYPICRRVEDTFWVRKQMYSVATARQVKKIRAELDRTGYRVIGEIQEQNRDKWWIYRRIGR